MKPSWTKEIALDAGQRTANRVRELVARNDTLADENADLRAQLAERDARIAALERALAFLGRHSNACAMWCSQCQDVPGKDELGRPCKGCHGTGRVDRECDCGFNAALRGEP